MGLGKSAMAGSPSEVASSRSLDGEVDQEALDARHGRDRRAHALAFDEKDRPDVGSMVVRVVSRTRRRDRRFRLSRVAGNPGPQHWKRLAATARLTRSVRNETVLSLGDDTTLCAYSLDLRRQATTRASPVQRLSADMVCRLSDYSQKAVWRRAFISRWKWFLCASFPASGPSTVRRCCRHRHAPS